MTVDSFQIARITLDTCIEVCIEVCMWDTCIEVCMQDITTDFWKRYQKMLQSWPAQNLWVLPQIPLGLGHMFTLTCLSNLNEKLAEQNDVSLLLLYHYCTTTTIKYIKWTGVRMCVCVHQFKTNCSVLKTDWGSPHLVLLFTECVLHHYILLFYTRFCRLGLQTIDRGLVPGT